MRILVTGAAGMLGNALVPLFQEDHEVVGLTRSACDLSDKDDVWEIFQSQKPELVFHLAAFTNVDGCEIDSQKAKASNEIATLNVAKAAKGVGAELLYSSTDHVFDGRAASPYSEDAPTHPLSIYGKTKLMGERHVQEILDRYFIVRNSCLYGPHGKNFVSTVLRLAGEKTELRIVNDQRGVPTYRLHLAQELAALAATRNHGVYHVAAEGNCTWCEFAERSWRSVACREFGCCPSRHRNAAVLPPARPTLCLANSGSRHRASGFCRIGRKDWKATLQKFVVEEMMLTQSSAND